jgi:PAS domain S-box-containing protein
LPAFTVCEAMHLLYEFRSFKNDPDSIYYDLLKKYFETGVTKINVITFPLWVKQLLAFLGIVAGVSLVAVIIFRIKLRKSTNRYFRLTENARDLIYRMSFPDGVYEYVSPASVDLFGYTPTEFYASPALIQKVIHPDWHKYFEEQWARLIVGDMPPFYEYQIIHKSGETKWMHQRNVMVSDDNGRPIAIEGIVTDITERKGAEKTLRENKEKLNEAQRIAQIGNWDLDLISNDLYWSEEVYRIFDLEPKQTVASYESFLSNIHPDDRELVNNAYTESVKNKTPYDIAHRLLLKDGSIKFVNECCETFYDDTGKASRSIGTIQDMTKLKQAEDELLKYQNDLEALVKEQTQELEEKVAELERMNKLFVGREFRIKELRDKIEELELKMGS